MLHRPTGYALGSGFRPNIAERAHEVWDTLAEAYAVLLRCDPDFAAWPLAGESEPARAACKIKFRWALGQ